MERRREGERERGDEERDAGTKGIGSRKRKGKIKRQGNVDTPLI